MGDPAAAHAHLEQGIALYDAEQSHELAFSRGTDPGVVCLARMAWALWWLGYPDRALARSHEAIALAQRLAHPYSLVFALQYNARLHMWRRESAFVKAQVEAAIALMQEHRLVNFLGGAMVLLGWVLVEQGTVAEGLMQIHRALDIHGIHGIKLGLYENLAMLAHAYSRAGQAEEGLRVLAEAIAAIHDNGESYCKAELYRLKGELLLQSDVKKVEEAEVCFRQALDIAHHQQAKSLELRAAMSIGHLWQRQGKRAEARQMLGEIYRWFTEGLDTLDLQETKALLEA
jgi:predicted ATPase